MIHCLMNQTRTSRYPTIRCQRNLSLMIHSPKSLNRMNHCLKTQTQTQTQKNRYRKIRCLKSRSLRNQNRMIRYLTCRIPKSLNQMTRCPRSPNRTIRYLTNQCQSSRRWLCRPKTHHSTFRYPIRCWCRFLCPYQ
jgi:hypothetical protein